MDHNMVNLIHQTRTVPGQAGGGLWMANCLVSDDHFHKQHNPIPGLCTDCLSTLKTVPMLLEESKRYHKDCSQPGQGLCEQIWR